MSDDIEFAEGYPIVSEEAVRKVRRVERAKGEELLVGLPKEELDKVGIVPGDSVDVKAEGDVIAIRKLVPRGGVIDQSERTHDKSRRNSPQ